METRAKRCKVLVGSILHQCLVKHKGKSSTAQAACGGSVTCVKNQDEHAAWEPNAFTNVVSPHLRLPRFLALC